MKPPPGFEPPSSGPAPMVCKLKKAIYGLKQASRSWFLTIKSVLLKLGFSQSKADNSLFFRISGGSTIYLLIYVDDILITGSLPSDIQQVIHQLNTHFSLKDLGDVHHFLGIEITKTAHGLHLSQGGYIKDLLHKLKMQDAKGCPTPMVSSCLLSKGDGVSNVDGKLYRSTVGALQYATITRPEIAFSVNKVSQYMSAPLDSHWKAVKRILRYIAGSKDHGLHMQKSSCTVTGFCDSDWAGDFDDRRSTTGYCVYMGKSLISWSSKKQAVVSRSSTEAEYRSLAHVVSEISWVKSLLSELSISVKVPVIWVDNMSTIALASNPVMHARTKHIELDIHFVTDKVSAGLIDLRHVPSQDQCADILTKPLSLQFFSRLKNALGVCSLTAIELREPVRSLIHTKLAPPQHDTQHLVSCRMKTHSNEDAFSSHESVQHST
ncbi:uncharacterized mitochondrial protein AtMg00810-like [Salvia miltiorrhiza]|uniref:uncharacterized mitochondrial protein AtMg00810-like n=1 Tax=Salvia miltiorrhiza TaxID=226208 RepID=UPI0025ABDF3C|nr:uncharacterized mitochondrial protein AtMg00810-like [Salvia miltiorrhiza]